MDHLNFEVALYNMADNAICAGHKQAQVGIKSYSLGQHWRLAYGAFETNARTWLKTVVRIFQPDR